MTEENILHLSHKQFLKTDRDYEKAASVVNLVYVKDDQPGINRIKKGKGFSYLFNDKPVKEKKEIIRIRKLAIPPAWKKVWVCQLENGHIQATGLDMRSRKQYRYHTLWNLLRNETKYHRLLEFGKSLEKLRLQIDHHLSGRELTQQKVLATVISLMEHTYIRVGNTGYEKLYGSYGLTTLKDKHVSINGDKMVFSFKGKKGIHHNITLRNKKLSKTVKACRDIPGKELFQYYDTDGTRKSIGSGLVNAYIREATGMDFTAKDFRTWAGSVQALIAFQSIGEALTEGDCKKNIISVMDIVSKQLGNTPAVCKKYYVHPALLKLYEEKKLNAYLNELNETKVSPDKTSVTCMENVLIKILTDIC
jgi:DNA topoisomerase I